MEQLRRQLGLLVFAAVLVMTPLSASAGTCEEGRAAWFDYRELQSDWVEPREVLSLLKACVEETETDARETEADARLLLAEAQLRVARDTKESVLFADAWNTLYTLSSRADVTPVERASALLLRAKWREYAPKEIYEALLGVSPAEPALAQALCGAVASARPASLEAYVKACFSARATAAQSEELLPAVKADPAVARKATAQRLILSYRVERTLSDDDWKTFGQGIRTVDASAVAMLRYFQSDAAAEGLCKQVSDAGPSCITLAKDYLRALGPTDAQLRGESASILAQWAGDAVLAQPSSSSELNDASRFLYERARLAQRVADAADSRGEPRPDQREIVLEEGSLLLVALMMHPERTALLAELKLQEKDVLALAENWLKVEHSSVYVSTQVQQLAALATARVMALEALPRQALKGSAEATTRLNALDQVLALSIDPSTPENRAWLEGPAPINNRDVALLAFARAASAHYHLMVEGVTPERKQAASQALDAFRFYVPSSSTGTSPRSADVARLSKLQWVPSAERTLKALSPS